MDECTFQLDVWYMTKDYKDLYKITKGDSTLYTVISFGDWKRQFIYPDIKSVLSFMSEHCYSHSKFERMVRKNG